MDQELILELSSFLVSARDGERAIGDISSRVEDDSDNQTFGNKLIRLLDAELRGNVTEDDLVQKINTVTSEDTELATWIENWLSEDNTSDEKRSMKNLLHGKILMLQAV